MPITTEQIDIMNQNLKQVAETGTATANAIYAAAMANRAITAFTLIEAYDNLKAYKPGNKVTYEGSTYQNIVKCTNILPTNKIYWICIAKHGEKGEKGDNGDKGDKGDKGDNATASDIIVQDLEGLFNSNPKNAENVLKELFTYVSNGKTAIASAITARGSSASGSDTFQQLSTKITNIPRQATFTTAMSGTTSPTTITINNITFTPTLIIAYHSQQYYSIAVFASYWNQFNLKLMNNDYSFTHAFGYSFSNGRLVMEVPKAASQYLVTMVL